MYVEILTLSLSISLSEKAGATQTQCVHFSGASGKQCSYLGPQMGQAKSKGLCDHGEQQQQQL